MSIFTPPKPTLLMPEDILELCSYRPELLAPAAPVPAPAPGLPTPPPPGSPPAADNWQLLRQFMVSYPTASPADKLTLFTPELVGAYIQLCRLTAPVTGTSIRQSRSASPHWLTMLTLGVLLISVLSLVLVSIYTYKPAQVNDNWCLNYAVFYYPILAGFLWGGLGSCVYVLKKVNDLQQARLFDDNQFTGVWARITLGATLGWVVVNIFNLEAMDLEGLGLPAVAFLTGLSVKVVYGVLEKAVDFLSEQLNVRKPKNQPQLSLTDKLGQVVLALDPVKDQQLITAIMQLQQLLAKTKPGL